VEETNHVLVETKNQSEAGRAEQVAAAPGGGALGYEHIDSFCVRWSYRTAQGVVGMVAAQRIGSRTTVSPSPRHSVS
jgi:hypothetical protein